jgi:hypothetical protein
MRRALAVLGLGLSLAMSVPAAAQWDVVGDQTVSGRVGIGTQTPALALHLASGSPNSIRFRLQNGDAQGPVDFFANDGIGGFVTGASGQFIALSVHPNNRVGIGSFTADQPLHLRQPITSRLVYRMQNAEGLIDQYTDGGAFGISTGATDRLIITSAGNVGIGTNTPTTRLDVAGTARVAVLEITGGSDLSERFEIAPAAGMQTAVTPGMVVSIDAANPGKLLVSSAAYDRTVAGIVSGAGNLEVGMLMGQAGSEATGRYPVALTGRVYVQADATTGAIQPGDLLTTSATPGHAMKVLDHSLAQGAILGKAMSTLDSGTGLVLVLVSLQ